MYLDLNNGNLAVNRLLKYGLRQFSSNIIGVSYNFYLIENLI